MFVLESAGLPCGVVSPRVASKTGNPPKMAGHQTLQLSRACSSCRRATQPSAVDRRESETKGHAALCGSRHWQITNHSMKARYVVIGSCRKLSMPRPSTELVSSVKKQRLLAGCRPGAVKIRDVADGTLAGNRYQAGACGNEKHIDSAQEQYPLHDETHS